MAERVSYITGLIIIAIFVGGIVVAMGKAKFITKDECDGRHTELTDAMCSKIDIIKTKIEGVQSDIEKVDVSIKEFTFFMGQVSQYMRDKR